MTKLCLLCILRFWFSSPRTGPPPHPDSGPGSEEWVRHAGMPLSNLILSVWMLGEAHHGLHVGWHLTYARLRWKLWLAEHIPISMSNLCGQCMTSLSLSWWVWEGQRWPLGGVCVIVWPCAGRWRSAVTVSPGTVSRVTQGVTGPTTESGRCRRLVQELWTSDGTHGASGQGHISLKVTNDNRAVVLRCLIHWGEYVLKCNSFSFLVALTLWILLNFKLQPTVLIET